MCVLTVSSADDTFVLQIDASLLGIEAVLSVIKDGEELLVSYFARQTRDAEGNYSATELEALGLVAAVEHFAHYLYGRSFTIYTDHKALCSLLSSNTFNRRLQRFTLKLHPLDVNIVYKPGRDNGNADGLSRQEWWEVNPEPTKENDRLDSPGQ